MSAGIPNISIVMKGSITYKTKVSLFYCLFEKKLIEDDLVREKDTSCTLTSPLAVEPFGLGNC